MKQSTRSTRRRFLATLATGVAAVSTSKFALGRRPVEDRVDPAAHRPVRIDRQADRGGGPAVHGPQRRHGRRTQGRTHRQGRHRCARNHQAHRAGLDLAGSRERPGGLRAHAAGAGGRSGGHRSEGADDRDGGGDVDHSDALAVHRALGIRVAAGHRADGRLGGEEQDQARRHAGDRLRPRHRRREDFRQALHRGRRHGGRIDPHAAAESGFRPVPAARQGRQAGRAVRFRSFRAGHCGDEDNSSIAAWPQPASR